VAAIVTLGDVVTFLEEQVATQPALAENLAAIRQYRVNYGIEA
jgi:orotate phosphoribosyltransferase